MELVKASGLKDMVCLDPIYKELDEYRDSERMGNRNIVVGAGGTYDA